MESETGLLIDSFASSTGPVTTDGDEVSELFVADDAIGETRRLTAKVVDASEGDVSIRTSSGALLMNPDVPAIGKYGVRWAGDGPEGLGWISLKTGTSGIANGVQLSGVIVDQAGATLEVRVDSNTGSSFITVELTPLTSKDFFFPFSDFERANGNGADFDKVDAVGLTLRATQPGTDGQIESIAICGGQSVTADIANPAFTGMISGTVFGDANRNRLFDSRESAFGSEVTVELLDDAGNVVDQQSTSGEYLFEEVEPGGYVVQLALSNREEQTAPRGAFGESDQRTAIEYVGRSIVDLDFDDDGDQDLALLSEINKTIAWYEHDSDGNLVELGSVELSGRPYALTSGDINGDGLVDLVASVLNSATPDSLSAGAVVLLSDGTGQFAPQPRIGLANGQLSLVVADLDGRNGVDLAFASFDDDQVRVRLNQGSGVFGTATSVEVGAQPIHLTEAHLDNDEHLDLVVSNFAADSVQILSNDGNGQFSITATIGTAFGPSATSVGDLDCDGLVDLAITAHGRLVDGEFQSDDMLEIVRQSADGSFVRSEEFNLGEGAHPRAVQVIDYDSDGQSDVIALRSEPSALALFAAGTECHLSADDVLETAPGATLFKATPFDQDGNLDLVSVGLRNQEVDGVELPFGEINVRLYERGTHTLTVGAGETLSGNDFGLFVEEQDQIQSAASSAGITSNPSVRADVNHNGMVDPMDALSIVNSLHAETPYDAALDMDEDGAIGPVDALLVINQLWHASTGTPSSAALAADTDAEQEERSSLIDALFANEEHNS